MAGSTFTTDAVDRLRELLPTEFPHSVPVYLLSRFAVPAEFMRGAGDCLAFTSSWLDLQLRPFLDAEGRWQGRGFAVIVVDIGLYYQSTVDSLVKVLLHEAAHRFQSPDCVLHQPVDTWPTEAMFFAQPPEPGPVSLFEKPVTQPPWSHHGARFIRALIHIHHRARVRGFDVPIEELSVAGTSYGLSPAAEYVDRLADEPERLANLHLWEALRTEPPAGFVELFEADSSVRDAGGAAGDGLVLSSVAPAGLAPEVSP